jgi:hypothetical protein
MCKTTNNEIFFCIQESSAGFFLQEAVVRNISNILVYKDIPERTSHYRRKISLILVLHASFDCCPQNPIVL